MENKNRPRGWKRYCCCYCNVYFYQIDSWQRHNRKHTGVEIECDDCGEMCSDSFELKSHQQICEAYRVYSEELFTEEPSNERTERKLGKEELQDTPDSTSKQELTNETDEPNNQTHTSWPNTGPVANDGETSPVVSNNEDSNKNSELDDLIGEDRGTNNAMEVTDEGPTQEENEDPETEALIGVDETVPEMKTENPTTNENKPADDNIGVVGVDSHIVIQVDSALNDAKRLSQQKLVDKISRNSDGPSFLSRPQSGPENLQVMNLENSELNKKYQPYFCKNCGARFTRKDSVTRHLKKGTCSGKSAIVCSICGKVFPELFELQQHFKLDHKNVLLAPTLVTHRTILPKPAEHPDQNRAQPFTAYPAPFVLRDQHHPPGSRQLASSNSQYRSITQHGIQGVFYPPSANQPSYRHRNNYPPTSHYREQHYPPPGRQYDLKYSPNSNGRKDGNEKFIEKMNRKRVEYHNREHFSERDDAYMSKRNKIDYESGHEKSFIRDQHTTETKSQINLSEYTNNAMNSQQYFSKRFVPKDKPSVPPSGSVDLNEPSNQVHQCKICGNEFPRFEYLLTHLRKHKEKPEDDEGKSHERQENEINDSNEISSDTVEKRANNIDSNKQLFTANHEPVTVVMQQPPLPRYSETVGADGFLQPADPAPPVYTLPPPQSQAIGESNMEAITPGVDGKFRPFICENCGQRFTRKDSLVRHAKKQTCYEEQTDLKCKHCDKTFRYHKCLVQHQELIHGISREEQSHNNPIRNSDEEDSDSDDRSEKNDQDDKRSSGEGKKYRSPTMELSPQPSKQQGFPQPPLHIIPHHQQRVNFAGTPFAQLENQASIPTPKFIPPRGIDEKFKTGHFQSDINGQPPQPPPPGSSQDAQYIGYCTVPRPFQCEYCGDRFAHRHSLKRHIRRHLGIGIPCNECGKLYRDQSEWRRHQRSIHNRHYEKYEVPNRISFRDGVENGMIGVIQNSEYTYDNNDMSDSEKSEEELSMVKPNKNSYSYNNNVRTNNPDPRRHYEANNKLTEVTDNSDIPMEGLMIEDGTSSKKMENKENKHLPNKSFNLNLHSAGDKDSRKSILDRYLRSSNSDDEDSETVVDRNETGIDRGELNEKVETNNNNNNIDKTEDKEHFEEYNKMSNNHERTVILAESAQI